MRSRILYSLYKRLCFCFFIQHVGFSRKKWIYSRHPVQLHLALSSSKRQEASVHLNALWISLAHFVTRKSAGTRTKASNNSEVKLIAASATSRCQKPTEILKISQKTLAVLTNSFQDISKHVETFKTKTLLLEILWILWFLIFLELLDETVVASWSPTASFLGDCRTPSVSSLEEMLSKLNAHLCHTLGIKMVRDGPRVRVPFW